MSTSKSSRDWLARQKKDPYVIKARQEGYRSRAAYKLIEIQERFHLVQKGMRVLELGAAPGSWTQLLAQWVGAPGEVFAVDILEMAEIPGVAFCQLDIESDAFTAWCAEIAEPGLDLVISDMAPNMSGNQVTDQLCSARLVELVIETASLYLKTGGNFLAKAFHGSEFNHLMKELRLCFKQVKVIKPDASRKASGEVYLLALSKK